MMFYRAATEWATASFTVYATTEAEMKENYSDAYETLTTEKNTIICGSKGTRDFFAKDLKDIQETMYFTRSKTRKAVTVPYTLVA